MMPVGGFTTVAMHSRRCATYHGQVEIVGRTEGGEIRGLVRRLFRGIGSLRLGDEVRFEMAVVRDGARVPLDTQHWARLEELMAARYMEVFFSRLRGRCEIKGEQYSFIAEITDKPRMRVPTKAEVFVAWAVYGLLLRLRGLQPVGIPPRLQLADGPRGRSSRDGSRRRDTRSGWRAQLVPKSIPRLDGGDEARRLTDLRAEGWRPTVRRRRGQRAIFPPLRRSSR